MRVVAGSRGRAPAACAENYRTFEDPSRWDRVPEATTSPETKEEVAKLNVMQWQNTKAVKRTKIALPVVR